MNIKTTRIEIGNLAKNVVISILIALIAIQIILFEDFVLNAIHLVLINYFRIPNKQLA